MSAELLIIFVKNPVPGTVKTRIARTVGTEKATAVYRELLAYTQQVTSDWNGHRTECRTAVYYGDFVNESDGWDGAEKFLQTGADLGERMQHAFAEQFGAGAGRVVIIGSDCFDITADHIHRAFRALDTADVVIGPAADGGYYLLGMKKLHPFLVENMPWSQPELRQLTELTLLQNGLTFERLDELSDIDVWADYEAHTNRTGAPGRPI